MSIDQKTQKEIQIKAATFDRLVKHLQENTQVQNIDLMIAGKFCRNCLYKWYQDEAATLGEDISVEAAQQKIYNMPYAEYKDKYQQPASDEQLAAFNKVHPPKI